MFMPLLATYSVFDGLLVQARMAEILTPGTVICLPTAPFAAPGQPQSAMWNSRFRIMTLTCLAGLLGAPQISLPLAEVDGLPVGVSLNAETGNDECLVGFALQSLSYVV